MFKSTSSAWPHILNVFDKRPASVVIGLIAKAYKECKSVFSGCYAPVFNMRFYPPVTSLNTPNALIASANIQSGTGTSGVTIFSVSVFCRKKLHAAVSKPYMMALTASFNPSAKIGLAGIRPIKKLRNHQ